MAIYFRQTVKKSQVECVKQTDYSTRYCTPLRTIVAYEFLRVLAAEDSGGRVRGDLLEGRKSQILGASKASNLKHKCLYAQPGQCMVPLNLKQYQYFVSYSERGLKGSSQPLVN